jgi:hypothetical protein
LKYKLEKKLVPEIYCEVCGNGNSKTTNSEIIIKSINEFHKDGTTKTHFTCSKHLVDLYKKLSKK